MTPQQREFLAANQQTEQKYFDLAKAEIGTGSPDWVRRVAIRAQELKAAARPLTIDDVLDHSHQQWKEGR